MKELDLWPSNSMVALAGSEPVAVITATKREDAVAIRRLGVHPEHLRQGHGRHLLTSLSQKLAVLGPPRLVAEVPAALAPARALFEGLGYRVAATLGDPVRDVATAAAGDPVPAELAAPVAAVELLATADLPPVPASAAGGAASRAWERGARTVRQRAERLAGLVAATPERVEAWLLYDPAGEPGPVDVWAAGWRAEAPGELLFTLLLRALAQRSGRSQRLPRLAPGELPAMLLARLGFATAGEHLLYAGEARPL
jgi:hypothetical protein